MEFLQGLREALSQGLSKDEFLDIWTKEYNAKQQCSDTDVVPSTNPGHMTSNSETSTSFFTASPLTAASQGDHFKDDDDDKQAIKSLMNQMSEQYLEMKQELAQLQKQQETFSSLHRQLQTQQQNMQEKHEKQHVSLLDKLCQIEAAVSCVNKLDQCISASVQQCFGREGQMLRDDLVEMIQKNHNHTVDEIQKQKVEIADCMRERLTDSQNKMAEQIRKSLEGIQNTLVLKQPPTDVKEAGIQITDMETKYDDDNGHREVDDSNTSEHRCGCDDLEPPALTKLVLTGSSKKKRPIKGGEPSSATKVKADTLRSVMRDELNGVIVELQKLILKPITSDDIVHQLVDNMKGLLSEERITQSNSLQEVQTAMSEEIRARFCQLQLSIKGHILKAVQDSPQPSSSHRKDEIQKFLEKLVKLEIINVRNDIEKLKSGVTFELPSKIVENVKATIFQELKDMFGHDEPSGNRKQATDFSGKKVTDKVQPSQADISSPVKVQETMLIVLVMQTIMAMVFSDLLDKEQHPSQNSNSATKQPSIVVLDTPDQATAAMQMGPQSQPKRSQKRNHRLKPSELRKLYPDN